MDKSSEQDSNEILSDKSPIFGKVCPRKPLPYILSDLVLSLFEMRNHIFFFFIKIRIMKVEKKKSFEKLPQRGRLKLLDL